MYCKHQVLKEMVVWRTAAPTLVLQYPLVTDKVTSDLQGTQKMLYCISQLRHWSYIYRKICGFGFFVWLVWVFLLKKLNILYLKLFSGKIHLAFWGWKSWVFLHSGVVFVPVQMNPTSVTGNGAGHLNLTVLSLGYLRAQAKDAQKWLSAGILATVQITRVIWSYIYR